MTRKDLVSTLEQRSGVVVQKVKIEKSEQFDYRYVVYFGADSSTPFRFASDVKEEKATYPLPFPEKDGEALRSQEGLIVNSMFLPFSPDRLSISDNLRFINSVIKQLQPDSSSSVAPSS